MTRFDLYETARLRCIDCGDELAGCLQRVAALRCHDCTELHAAGPALEALAVHEMRRAARQVAFRRSFRSQAECAAVLAARLAVV